MIETQSLAKTYGRGMYALRRLTLKVEKGDTVFLTETPDGYRLTPYDPTFEEQMGKAREIMKRRRNALRELAK